MQVFQFFSNQTMLLDLNTFLYTFESVYLQVKVLLHQDQCLSYSPQLQLQQLLHRQLGRGVGQNRGRQQDQRQGAVEPPGDPAPCAEHERQDDHHRRTGDRADAERGPEERAGLPASWIGVRIPVAGVLDPSGLEGATTVTARAVARQARGVRPDPQCDW